MSLIREFYANWDVRYIDNLVPIRGTLIEFLSRALCKALDSLCVNSNIMWMCNKKVTHGTMPKVKFLKPTKVS